MTKKDQIAFLEAFIVVWDGCSETFDQQELKLLTGTLQIFCRHQNLPYITADGLLLLLRYPESYERFASRRDFKKPSGQ